MSYNSNIEKLAEQAILIHRDCCKNPHCNNDANEYCLYCHAALWDEDEFITKILN